MRLVFGLLIGYIIGSIPFSYLVGKIIGRVDLREKGSGNLGTTNVIRNLGLAAGILAYVLDMLKGLIPVLLVHRFWGYSPAIMTGIGAIVGHCYSLFFNFQGGKGIAVSSGVLFALDPLIAMILITGQLIIFFTTRMMGLASIGFEIVHRRVGAAVLASSFVVDKSTYGTYVFCHFISSSLVFFYIYMAYLLNAL